MWQLLRPPGGAPGQASPPDDWLVPTASSAPGPGQVAAVHSRHACEADHRHYLHEQAVLDDAVAQLASWFEADHAAQQQAIADAVNQGMAHLPRTTRMPRPRFRGRP